MKYLIAITKIHSDSLPHFSRLSASICGLDPALTCLNIFFYFSAISSRILFISSLAVPSCRVFSRAARKSPNLM